jgi:hypothetical protein
VAAGTHRSDVHVLHRQLVKQRIATLQCDTEGAVDMRQEFCLETAGELGGLMGQCEQQCARVCGKSTIALCHKSAQFVLVELGL